MIYYAVYEYFAEEEGNPEEKRLIYTFDNEMAAHDMVEFILRNDAMPIDIRVEECEITT